MILRYKTQNWKRKSAFILKIDYVETKCGVRQIIIIISFICVTYVQKDFFFNLNFNQAVINKISNFHEIAQNFTYSQK